MSVQTFVEPRTRALVQVSGRIVNRHRGRHTPVVVPAPFRGSPAWIMYLRAMRRRSSVATRTGSASGERTRCRQRWPQSKATE